MSKFKRAKDAIDDVFSDTSVSPSTTREMLEDLQADIESKLDSLPKAAEELSEGCKQAGKEIYALHRSPFCSGEPVFT